jgi:hypothetical protein
MGLASPDVALPAVSYVLLYVKVDNQFRGTHYESMEPLKTQRDLSVIR